MRSVYYNVYDYGRRMGAYTATELQTMIRCGRSIPGQYADLGKAYRGRYTFERIEDAGGLSVTDLAAEWDKTRLTLLKATGAEVTR